jgi:hypothetical protein
VQNIGDKLVFKCEDSSDLNFCKTNSNFDEYLTKYKGDAYRSKAYIHQMLTRCFLSAICNGNSLLNSTLVSGKGAKQKSVPKEHMKNNNNNQQQKSTVDDNGGGRRKSILSAKKSFNVCNK